MLENQTHGDTQGHALVQNSSLGGQSLLEEGSEQGLSH